MATLVGSLIHSDFLNRRKIGLSAGLLDIMIQNSPETGIMFSDDSTQRLDRHLLGHNHNQSLKQQGKATFRTGPRDPDQSHATRLAINPRYPGMKLCFVLKEV